MGKKGENKVVDIVSRISCSSTQARVTSRSKPIQKTIDFTNSDLSNFLKTLKEFEDYSTTVDFIVN